MNWVYQAINCLSRSILMQYIAAMSFLGAVGAQVRSQRERRGWSRRELAAASGVSERFLAQLEGGEGNISLRRFAEVAHALGTTPAALLAPAAAAPTARPIALLGVRGAGKSSVGAALAKKLGLRFVEVDREIEEAAGLALVDIFTLHGEAYNRRVEREVLTRLVAQPGVLATGGSIVNDATNFALLEKRARTVWLRATAEDHWNRVVAQGDQRPMAENPHAFEELRALLAARQKLYARADRTVDTSGKTVKQVVAELVAETRAHTPPRSRACSYRPHGQSSQAVRQGHHHCRPRAARSAAQGGRRPARDARARQRPAPRSAHPARGSARGARDGRGEAVLPGRDGEAHRGSAPRGSRGAPVDQAPARRHARDAARRLHVRGEAVGALGAGRASRARGRGEAPVPRGQGAAVARRTRGTRQRAARDVRRADAGAPVAAGAAADGRRREAAVATLAGASARRRRSRRRSPRIRRRPARSPVRARTRGGGGRRGSARRRSRRR